MCSVFLQAVTLILLPELLKGHFLFFTLVLLSSLGCCVAVSHGLGLSSAPSSVLQSTEHLRNDY